MKVYLAGPITGLSYEDSIAWREFAYDYLLAFDIDGYSPMRGKAFLKKELEKSGEKVFTIDGDKYKDVSPLSSNRGIMTRDRYDATTCDLMLVNFLGATRVSIGTAMEIAWADLKRIPIVMVIEDKGNPHDHCMITEAVGFRVNNLNEGLHIVKTVLLP